MKKGRIKKDYLPPECEMFLLSAFDVLNGSGNIPGGSTNEDIDENQGIWVG